MNDGKIIGTLIGLVNSCNNNPKTSNTDLILIKALAFSSLYPNATEEEIEKQITEIIEEKKKIVPDCFVCMNPCGNTSDYDLKQIYQAEKSICEIKCQILENLREIAAYLYEINAAEFQMESIYHALSYISYDLEFDFYQEMLNKIIQLKDRYTQKGSE